MEMPNVAATMENSFSTQSKTACAVLFNDRPFSTCSKFPDSRKVDIDIPERQRPRV